MLRLGATALRATVPRTAALRSLHTATLLRSQEQDDKDAKAEAEALQRTVDRSKLRQLSFDDYIALKKKLTRIGYVMALPSYLGGVALSSSVCIGYMPNLFPATPEEVELVMGMEPLVVAAGISTVGGVFSALLGSSLFGSLWRLMNPTQAAVMDTRELDFRLRIIRNREGGEEFSHDFYGDKIKNIKDYRNWLKEQRKYRRKQDTGVSLSPEESKA